MAGLCGGLWKGQGPKQAALGKRDFAWRLAGGGLLCSCVQARGWLGHTGGEQFSGGVRAVSCWHLLGVAASQCCRLEVVGMRSKGLSDLVGIIVPRETIPRGSFFWVRKIAEFSLKLPKYQISVFFRQMTEE
jgi:hypothetical protein